MASPPTTTTTKARIDKALGDAKPLYAVVGAGDLAAQIIREARVKFDAKAMRDLAQATISARIEGLQAEVKNAPEQVLDIPVRMQAAVSDVVTNTVQTYGDLASRGRSLFTRVRKQQSTEDLERQLKSTVSRTKAAATTAKKSVKTTAASAQSTTSTAKRAADSTKSSAKAATTTARKTAAAAKQATEDAVDKAGD